MDVGIGADSLDGSEEFNRELGEQLRRVRRQKRLSLLDVEALSDKEFKASVLGAYERGERALTVARLARLAELYRVPLYALLPPGAGRPPPPERVDESVSLDLRALRELETPEARTLLAYVRSLQEMRGDWGTDVFTIRAADVRAIASVLDTTPGGFVVKIDELGVRAG